MQLDEGLSCISYGTVEPLVSTGAECKERLKSDWSYRNERSMFLPHRAIRKVRSVKRVRIGVGRGLNSEILQGYTVTVLLRGHSVF